MKLFDTHCHLNSEVYDNDLESAIKQAQSVGVERMVVVGCDRPSIDRALSIAESHEAIYAATAWHPVDVIDCTEDDKKYLEKTWDHPKVVAVGETGLDYHWDKSPHELQKSFFEWHVEAAIQRKLPFIIHNREAHHDTLTLLQDMHKKYGELHGVMHSFSGSAEMASSFLRLGLHISVSGVVTFKNVKHLKDVLPLIPQDKLLIETDAPYLTPMPYRGQRNEPAYVLYVAQKIAELLSVDPDTIATQTFNNAVSFFQLDK